MAQRLLRERVIVNPLGEYINFPDGLMRTRRDNERFMDLIASICFLRQYQKEEKEEVAEGTGEVRRYIECDLRDYEIAYEIVEGILPATMSSIPKGAVMLYGLIREMVRGRGKEEGVKAEEVRFTQREVREESGYNQMFVKRYVRELMEYEYLRVSGSRVRGARQSYQLVKDEEIKIFDLSNIPGPEEVRKRVEGSRKRG